MSRSRLIYHGRVATPVDTTPDAFTFTDVSNVTLSIPETSNTITVSGLGAGVSVSATVSGGTFQKNGGPFSSSASTAQNGDTFAVQHTSSSFNSTAVNTTLAIGVVSDTFTSTTVAAAGGAIIYDARFGTDSPSAIISNGGWFTFGLKPGCRRVWCDANQADDTGNGLSAATAKKTLPAAWVVFTGAGWTSGDQLMIAGKGGRSYTDDHSSTGWFNNQGVSTTYPTAVLSYDPADAANATKYGKLLGDDSPLLILADPATWPADPLGNKNWMFGNATEGALGDHGNFVVQGIILDGQGRESQGVGTAAKHDGICWQNCHFRGLLMGNNNANSPNGKSLNTNYSKCSFYGPWQASNGNSSGMFNDDLDGLWVQDCVFAHCGWAMGSSRDDDHTIGGTSVFGHGNYYAAGNINGRFDRNVYIDSASDGYGMRGSCAATQLVSIDEPIIGAISGYSSSYLDNPAGSIVRLDDFVAIGGVNIWSDAAAKGDGKRGQGQSAINARAGSYVNNGVMFDNQVFGTGDAGNQFVFAITNSNNAQIDQVVNVSNIRTHNYSGVAESRFYLTGNASKAIINWSNCLLDTLTSIGSGGTTTISGTGMRTWVGADYPTPLTRGQVTTALGFSTKADMVNAMLEYPHLPWAQAIIGICFPAFGATPIYATASVPSIAGLATPPVVYKTTLSNLTISTLAFAHASASAAVMSGCSANFTLSSADLPTGFSIIGRSLKYDGTGSAGTPTIHVLETNLDGAGTHTTAFTLAIS